MSLPLVVNPLGLKDDNDDFSAVVHPMDVGDDDDAPAKGPFQGSERRRRVSCEWSIPWIYMMAISFTQVVRSMDPTDDDEFPASDPWS